MAQALYQHREAAANSMMTAFALPMAVVAQAPSPTLVVQHRHMSIMALKSLGLYATCGYAAYASVDKYLFLDAHPRMWRLFPRRSRSQDFSAAVWTGRKPAASAVLVHLQPRWRHQPLE